MRDKAGIDLAPTQVIRRAAISVAAAGDVTVVAAVTGKKIRVFNVVLTAEGAGTVRFESGTGGTALTGLITLATGGGFAPGFDPYGHFETAESALLNLEVTTMTGCDGWITYAYIDADGREY